MLHKQSNVSLKHFLLEFLRHLTTLNFLLTLLLQKVGIFIILLFDDEGFIYKGEMKK